MSCRRTGALLSLVQRQKKGVGGERRVLACPLYWSYPPSVVLGELAALAGPSQAQDLRVVHEPVGDRGGHRGRVKHLSPVSKGQVGGKHGGLPLVPLADDLAEEVRALWAKGKIT